MNNFILDSGSASTNRKKLARSPIHYKKSISYYCKPERQAGADVSQIDCVCRKRTLLIGTQVKSEAQERET